METRKVINNQLIVNVSSEISYHRVLLFLHVRYVKASLISKNAGSNPALTYTHLRTADNLIVFVPGASGLRVKFRENVRLTFSLNLTRLIQTPDTDYGHLFLAYRIS